MALSVMREKTPCVVSVLPLNQNSGLVDVFVIDMLGRSKKLVNVGRVSLTDLNNGPFKTIGLTGSSRNVAKFWMIA